MFGKVKSGFGDFKNGLSIIFGKPSPGEGDRKLAKMSELVMAQIPVYGKMAVTKQMVKAIEDDMKRYAKKGGQQEIDYRISNAIATPEYMKLLHRLNLNEAHLRVAGMQAMRKLESKAVR